jgi:hypothetical protein
MITGPSYTNDWRGFRHRGLHARNGRLVRVQRGADSGGPANINRPNLFFHCRLHLQLGSRDTRYRERNTTEAHAGLRDQPRAVL